MQRALSDEVGRVDAVEVSTLIRSWEVSPVELTEAMLARIEAVDPKLHRYALVTPDVAPSQAMAAEAEIGQGRWRGPLHGIPIGLCFASIGSDTGGRFEYRRLDPLRRP